VRRRYPESRPVACRVPPEIIAENRRIVTRRIVIRAAARTSPARWSQDIPAKRLLPARDHVQGAMITDSE
jgi:hypothetical protein